MTTSLQKNSTTVNEKEIAERLLDSPINSSRRIGGGMNSQVFQVCTKDGAQRVLKLYFRHDRLLTEFSSLEFLHQYGVRAIAQPIAIDEDLDCAVYAYIEGKKITRDDITSNDITQAVAFCASLKRIKGQFPSASEAYFSVHAVIENIYARFARLKEVQGSGREYENFTSYLIKEFEPFFKKLTQWAQHQCQIAGISYRDEIEDHQKLLSSSDLGFHNALRDEKGQIVFVDFEHFGWDDPAKTISDFMLHPAMALNEHLKKQFVSEMFELLDDNDKIKERTAILYPVFGLKWCMILL